MRIILNRIIDNISALSNMIIIDTQSHGCASLVSMVRSLSSDKVFVYMDVRNCATEEQFCNEYLGAVKSEVGIENVIDFETSLSLPQRIAIERGQNVIVWIDGFHQIKNYAESIALQRMLRSHWQKHTNVAYCLLGSDVRFMSELCGNPDKPLYMFGSVITGVVGLEWNKMMIQN